MADCYYHGYSGSPGPCSQCEAEDRARESRGARGLTLDDSRSVMELANQNSIGRKNSKKKVDKRT